MLSDTTINVFKMTCSLNNEVGRLVCRHWIYVFLADVFLKQVKMTVFV